MTNPKLEIAKKFLEGSPLTEEQTQVLQGPLDQPTPEDEQERGRFEKFANERAAFDYFCSREATPSHALMADWSDHVQQLLQDAEPLEDPWHELTNRQKAFLLRFVELGSILRAAAGVCHPAAHYRWQGVSEAYAKAYSEAIQMVKDKLLGFAHHLAIFGERIPLLNRNQNPHTCHRDGRLMFETKRDNRLLLSLVKQYLQIKVPSAKGTAFAT